MTINSSFLQETDKVVVGELKKFLAEEAFSRSLGWMSSEEMKVLRTKTVAIAGCGGVGGHYAEVMARLGVQRFHIADMDVFETVNFNRQNSSGISTLGKAKVEVIRKKILDINPNAQIKVFPKGVQKDNMVEFVDGVDLYLDGLDFFVIDQRIDLFEALRQKNIPAITVAPTGMGASLLVFDSSSMSFADYFGMKKEQTIEEKAIRFLVGLTPTLIQRKYQIDKTKVNFAEQRVPSTPMGCFLCAGIAGTTAMKILLKRGPLKTAPWSLHFDAYSLEYKKTYTFLGAKNPLQMIKRWIAKKLTAPQTSESIFDSI
jgi:molybdopterin/thiamine biosynthesis adenylyltransferase